MRVVTYYSYKGGVGRTLAAANFAVYLAKRGQRVVLIDFDLDAPGLDCKFEDLVLPDGQLGLLDYILTFQRDNSIPDTLEAFTVQVHAEADAYTGSLTLMPAGNYLSSDYPTDLDELDWRKLFSTERNGVGFFQDLRGRLAEEFDADFIVVDSRSGIGEIAGVCTQQLADEVVMFTSLSRESIKLTKVVAAGIRDSAVAKELGKTVDVKVVIARVPKPDDLPAMKDRWLPEFGVEDDHLFFQFHSHELASEEYLAVDGPNRDEALTQSYTQLFDGLNLGLGDDSIKDAVRSAWDSLRHRPPEEADRRMLDAVTLYPGTPVYREAMRFFGARQDHAKAHQYAMRLYRTGELGGDVQQTLANWYLTVGLDQVDDVGVACDVLAQRWRVGDMQDDDEVLRLLSLLAAVEDDNTVLEVADGAMAATDPPLDDDTRGRIATVASGAALRLDLEALAHDFITGVPLASLPREGRTTYVTVMVERGLHAVALDAVLTWVSSEYDEALLRVGAELAAYADRMEDLAKVVKSALWYPAISGQDAFQHLIEECRLVVWM